MKILFIAPYIPYKGIDHAGGYFFFEYLQGLHKHGVEIHILAPNDSINQSAIRKIPDWLNVELAGQYIIPKKNNIFYGLSKIKGILTDPIGLLPYQMKSLADAINRDGFLNQFNLIELQWSQMLPLVEIIKIKAPSLPVTMLEHDVMTQSITRAAKDLPWSKNKILSLLKLLRIKEKEKTYLNKCDKIFVFSKKDKSLLMEMNVKKPIEIIAPAIEIPSISPRKKKEKLNCLFVGAMHRVENQNAMKWFIDNVWNNVIKEIPEVNLIIAGSSPPSWLKTYETKRIIVTGYVEDLGEYYKNATVFIAPLLTGAGVKFKILQALAYGIPVVTTPVGAEGINEDNEDIFAIVTVDPKKFGNEIIHLFTDEEYRRSVGEKGRKWVLKKYDFQKNTIDKVLSEYNKLLKINK